MFLLLYFLFLAVATLLKVKQKFVQTHSKYLFIFVRI